jgi:hypothetical protein
MGLTRGDRQASTLIGRDVAGLALSRASDVAADAVDAKTCRALRPGRARRAVPEKRRAPHPHRATQPRRATRSGLAADSRRASRSRGTAGARLTADAGRAARACQRAARTGRARGPGRARGSGDARRAGHPSRAGSAAASRNDCAAMSARAHNRSAGAAGPGSADTARDRSAVGAGLPSSTARTVSVKTSRTLAGAAAGGSRVGAAAEAWVAARSLGHLARAKAEVT